MNTNNNEKLRSVSMKNGLISIEFKPQIEYKDTYKNESIDNTVKLFSHNKIVSLPMYKPIPKKDKSQIEFYPSMSVNDFNDKVTDIKPLSVIEYCLKGLKLNLDKSSIIDLSNKIKLSSSDDMIQIRNVLIPIMNVKGIGKTLDLRVWINKDTLKSIDIDNKQTTVSMLYNEQIKQEHNKQLKHDQYLRYKENKKNGNVKTTISSMDYLSMHIINHIGHKANLPIIDLWQNAHITTTYDLNNKLHIVSVNTPNLLTVSDDTQKHAIAYLKLHNQRLNVEKVMNQRLSNFLNTHKSRLVTAKTITV